MRFQAKGDFLNCILTDFGRWKVTDSNAGKRNVKYQEIRVKKQLRISRLVDADKILVYDRVIYIT